MTVGIGSLRPMRAAGEFMRSAASWLWTFFFKAAGTAGALAGFFAEDLAGAADFAVFIGAALLADLLAATEIRVNINRILTFGE